MSGRGPVSGSLRWWFRSSSRKRKRAHSLLDVPRPIVWGRTSRQDGVAWTCQICRCKNYPTRYLFVKLPAFQCGGCNAKRRVNFRFSFGNLAANAKCPIGVILDQGQTDDCLLYALTKAAEITDRIRTILSGSDDVVPTLDPRSLRRTFRSSRLADGLDENEINYKDDAAMVDMIGLMETIGIEDKTRQYTSRIGGMEFVTGDFENIVTELANGYPLVVDIIPGGSFADLSYGHIYKCPFNLSTVGGRTVTIHTVVLVGASRWGNVDYFYFVNSYGDWWCFRVHKTNESQIGGIGKIFAEDIISVPIKFMRYPR